jgi:hypothetical protein
MTTKISISKGNIKMGEIQSVSLPPIVTCAEHCTCAKKCYAARMCRRWKNTREAYNRNLEIFRNDSAEYWKQIDDVLYANRFFRFHVAGDIPTYDYLLDMIETVRNNPHCETLVFTKRYYMVNKALESGVKLPNNLHLVFSEWEGMDMPNPYNLPVAHVIFKGEEPESNWKICTGNCLECAKGRANCWTLKNGEHVAFHEH